jgi:hypothetical protein
MVAEAHIRNKDAWGMARLAGMSALLAAGLPLPAHAQRVETSEASDTIVVQGLNHNGLRAIVDHAAAAESEDIVPQFRTWLCVGIQGLKPAYAKLLSDRIRDVARGARIRLRTKRCTPNLSIVFPKNPDMFTAELVRKHPMLFRDPDRGMAPASLIVALRKPRPVRWFGVTRAIQRHSGMWRLGAPVRIDKLGAVVIVDVTKLYDVSWNQLGDYIGLCAFANPRMDAVYPHKTTALSLFDDRDAGRSMPVGLTTFDRSLLSAIYRVDEGLSGRLQRRKIISDVARGRTESDKAE